MACTTRDRQRPSEQNGQTLLELVIVIGILTLAAAVAVPSANSTRLQQLDLAGSHVADAFRYAREEARRTGVMHGVSVDTPNNLIRVFQVDEVAIPKLKIFDVRHPVTKQLYSIQTGASPYANVDLASYGGQLVGTCSDPGDIAFDVQGVVRCVEPAATRIENATVELSAGAFTLTVAIDSYTGRVSTQ